MIATIVIAVVVAILVTLFRKDYLRRASLIDDDIKRQYAQLSAAARQNQIQLWIYSVKSGMFQWLDEEEQLFTELQPNAFMGRYTPNIYQHISQTLQSFIRGELTEKTLRIGMTIKDGTKRYYALRLSVLRRDEMNDIDLIIATQTDITEQHLRETREKELKLRLSAITTALKAFDDINTQHQADDEKEEQLLEAKEQAHRELADYMHKIDYVIKMGDIRLAEYSPVNHTLTIYSEIDRIQLSLSEARALRFVDETSIKEAQRLLSGMDRRVAAPFDGQIKTIIPHRDAGVLHLQLSFIPVNDENGQVSNYFGMIRDIGRFKAMELSLATETVRARQLEANKNNFMRNMSFHIRTPLNAVVGFADLFQQEHSPEDETVFSTQIRDNASQLLMLINGILFLSRLDAGMIERNTKTTDVAAAFEGFCKFGWGEYQKDGVEYIIDNAFERLVIEDIDINNIGLVVSQLCANGAIKTEKGHVTAKCEYIIDKLVIIVESTGPGLTPDILEHVFERFGTSLQTGTSLSLPICYEVMKMLGGEIHIDSEPGRVTQVCLSLPCRATEIIRKSKGGQP